MIATAIGPCPHGKVDEICWTCTCDRASAEIDWSRSPVTPRAHQIIGTQALIREVDPTIGRIYPGCFALADEVGAGKTKQVIDADQVLFETDVIDTVLVIAPGYARGVWANPTIGELAKHSWPSVDNRVIEYSTHQPRSIVRIKDGGLLWVITNYEFVRREDRLEALSKFLKGRSYQIVADEAWNLKDHTTSQWKAVNTLRKGATRIVLLNGTMVAESPLDLYAQMRLLHPGILGTAYSNKFGNIVYTGFLQFRARYALLKPNVSFPMIIGFQNLEELREKVRPYVLFRKTRDCFDLPPILDPVLIEVPLSDDDWRIYKEMRDNMVAWLDTSEAGTGEASVTQQAMVRSIRLAQITSGFLGGIRQIDLLTGASEGDELLPAEPPREIGREKLDALLKWLGRQPAGQPERLLVLSQFRLEIERTARELAHVRRTLLLYGQQSQGDREEALLALSPDVPQEAPVAVVMNPAAGGAAINAAGASVMIVLSQNAKRRVRVQARGRIDRPGQVEAIRYIDIVATGPKGQKTIDHHTIASLQGKDDMASWTTATWRAKLLEE